MTIKGPVNETMLLDVRRYKGAQGIDPNEAAQLVSDAVSSIMQDDMGMPVNARSDEYKIGGGLFGSGTISPAVVFTSQSFSDYASVFAAFDKTGAILEVTIAQGTPTSRNYQKVAQGKLFSDKTAAQKEDSYYAAVCQAIDEAMTGIIG